ncbi:hypothetical protein DRQ18_02860 [bacterium]|nr:MAG: hypothetical protein DRQ18_02860 [bacterium]
MIFLFLLLSFFFSASETAIFSLPSWRILFLSRKGKIGKILGLITRNPSVLLISIILANTFVNIAFSTYFEDAIKLSFLYQTFIITFIILIAGEITPKMIAVYHAERFSLFSSPLLLPVHFVLFPVSWLINIMQGRIKGGRKEKITLKDIEMLVEMGKERGVVRETEAVLFKGILSLVEKKARDLMVPRVNILFVPENASVDQALETIRRARTERALVYRGTRDNVVGILHAKDIFASGGKTVKDVMKPAIFIPEEASSREILELFHRKREKCAVVVDEYGGTEGLVQMEDLFAEALGKYSWETLYQVLPDGYLVDGEMEIKELEELLGIELPRGDYNTVAGLIYSLLGRVPREGETYSYHELIFTIESVRGRKIEKVKVTKR